MKKYLFTTLFISALFASNTEVKVLSETTVKINNNTFDIYRIQQICKDNYQYTVAIKGSSISITQDFKTTSNNYTDPIIVKCK